jgi:ferredoxin
MRIKLILKNCVGCGACVEICPHNAIPDTLIGFISSLARINKLKCDGCGDCIRVCTHDAIELVNGIVSKDKI